MTPQAFGHQLRRHREKRGVSLQQIADETKVAASVFAALERGDCARWPGGIYSRGFVRAYAVAVGLDADEVVEQFCECFPEAARPQPVEEIPAEEQGPPRAVDRLRSALAAWFGTSATDRR